MNFIKWGDITAELLFPVGHKTFLIIKPKEKVHALPIQAPLKHILLSPPHGKPKGSKIK